MLTTLALVQNKTHPCQMKTTTSGIAYSVLDLPGIIDLTWYFSIPRRFSLLNGDLLTVVLNNVIM